MDRTVLLLPVTTTSGLSLLAGEDISPNRRKHIRIQYITIASTGNTLQTLVILTLSRNDLTTGASCSSGTRGIIAGNAAITEASYMLSIL